MCSSNLQTWIAQMVGCLLATASVATGSAEARADSSDAGDAAVVSRFVQTIHPAEATENAVGAAPAVDGDTIVVTDPGDSFNGTGAVGVAFVFERQEEGWEQTQVLRNPDGDSADSFGTSVAIDGDTMVVGAPDETFSGNDRVGAAYLYRRESDQWEMQQKLVASDPLSRAGFGTDVVVRGASVLVGAPGVPSGDSHDAGAIYVFEAEESGWSERTKLTAADPSESAGLGERLALGAEAVFAVAPRADYEGVGAAGTLHVFGQGAEGWQHRAKLGSPDPTTEAKFGNNISAGGETVLVGAHDKAQGDDDEVGVAHLFGRTGGSWAHETTLSAADAAAGDGFGSGGAIEGRFAVVGAYGDDHAGGSEAPGSTYPFVRDDGGWRQLDKLMVGAGNHDYFGSGTAISDRTVVTGAPGYGDDGATAIYRLLDDADGDGVPDVDDNCPSTQNEPQADRDDDGTGDACDGCPDDPNKASAVECGCGTPDVDSDGDGTPDCEDGCVEAPDKTSPGRCGCGMPEVDRRPSTLPASPPATPRLEERGDGDGAWRWMSVR